MALRRSLVGLDGVENARGMSDVSERGTPADWATFCKESRLPAGRTKVRRIAAMTIRRIGESVFR